MANACPSATALCERWSQRSLATVWPATDAEWRCAAVDAVCQGLTQTGESGLDLVSASRSLGEQRVEVGTYLREARDDFEIGLRLAGVGRLRRWELLDALTVGWAEWSADRLEGAPLTDRVNRLATMGYLSMRLAELYRESEASGEPVAARYLLVVVDTCEAPARLIGEARLLTLHSALQYAFVGGESIVTVTPNRVAALCAQDQPRLADSLARLRSELKIALAERRLRSAYCWQQALPAQASGLDEVLRRLCY